MDKPQVTITLGGSGQRVVKESWRDCNGGLPNPRSGVSGNKRSLAESSAGNGGRSFSYNKKMREDTSVRRYAYGGTNESSIGPKDLRLKLTRKRVFRGLALQNEKHRKMELQEKVSRAIRSLESSLGEGTSRNAPLSRGITNTLQLNSVKSYSASWNPNAMRSRTTDQLMESSGGFQGARRSIGERPQFPLMRGKDTSRTSNVFHKEPLGSSRSKAPILTTSKCHLSSGNLLAPPAPTTGGISATPHLDSQLSTVNGLLQSLGLTKYSINFQAEEIDMVALKQMGDNDLKELGIPMGPRKKILLSLQPQMKRAPILARGSSRAM